jgi:pimeloyl-ACP methyl ester carboxylesterase
MPQDTHEITTTQFAEAGGIRFAYRRFGRRGGTPLLLLNYFAANLDSWDPKVTNGFAAERDVILFDYPGIGGSSGETPSTVAALTKACVEFCRALNLTRFDVMGFSLGGMIAQQLAADHPEMVRRIILLGTGPRGGEGMVFGELSVDELDDEAGLLMNAFFAQSEPSKVAGRAYVERLKLRVADRTRRCPSWQPSPSWLPSASGASSLKRTVSRCWAGSIIQRWWSMETRTSSSSRSTHSSSPSICPMLSSSCTPMRATAHNPSMRRSPWSTRGSF